MEEKDRGASYEQLLTVGQLVDALANRDRGERVCVCHVERFGREEFRPVLAVGQMHGAGDREDLVCLYCIEGRDDD